MAGLLVLSLHVHIAAFGKASRWLQDNWKCLSRFARLFYQLSYELPHFYWSISGYSFEIIAYAFGYLQHPQLIFCYKEDDSTLFGAT